MFVPEGRYGAAADGGRDIFAVPVRPQLHFPSPYLLPTAHLACARRVPMPDGALIASFVYVPGGAALPAADLSQTLAALPSAVLMLHGNGEEHGIFGQVIDAVVRAGHPVVALDSRAQGKSTRGDAPLSYELMARDALAVLDALGVEQVHLLGFSDGAIEALLIARDNPQVALSLTALGANLTPGGVDDADEMERLSRELAAWAKHWTSGNDGSTVDADILQPTPEEALRTAELLHLMVVQPQIEAASLGRIACPTTIMAGEFDEILPEETRRIHQAIPGSRLVIVPGAGHTLPKEAPAAVSAALLETIARAGVFAADEDPGALEVVVHEEE